MEAQGSAANGRRRHEYLVGIALLMLVVLLWTASNFLTNTILTGSYNKPFAVTYLNTSSFAIYLIPFTCLHRARRRSASSNLPKDETESSFWTRIGFYIPQSDSSAPEDHRGRYAPLSSVHSDSSERRSAKPPSPTRRRSHLSAPRPSSIDGRRPRSLLESRHGTDVYRQLPADAPLSLRETAILAFQFTIVWFGANWSLNAGLGLTSVASGTTLSSASGFFTLALGSLLGVETFTLPKLAAVLISFVGVAMVTRADSASLLADDAISNPINALLGDALSLLSALLYAVYVTLLKVRIGSEERVSMPLFFGFVGIFNILGMWPVGVLLHLIGVERIEPPGEVSTWAGIGVNMAITFVSDFAYLLAMLKSSPLVATIGLSLTIPLALVGDIARGTHSGGWLGDIGSVCVLLSFVAIGLADHALISREAPASHLPVTGRHLASE
ncbi:hypothetical protein IE81DRAFT_320970 [Ceraceosorus guamensis]|uniref:DUF3955 domain-containing protein n=1 Tax=Ceraceosorus guamensis TaxID=1522189 RepID=A0A316W425_9BASI|nr:hypothetical protein IE81DRAFT_320970 [Ceraceosorus guamensis]PWN44667.1 hypothetical protein IE81DRAFT_320970 [Ceraceosorus guamensis]